MCSEAGCFEATVIITRIMICEIAQKMGEVEWQNNKGEKEQWIQRSKWSVV